MMKTCIWCNKTEESVLFTNIAHIVPKALGGTMICTNVCNNCNDYFGKAHNGIPSLDLVFKETFNITRARFLQSNNAIGKNKSLSHFSSIYFKYDIGKRKIDVKPAFKLKPGFQNILCRQLKKGLYKVFLEENERINQNGSDNKFDFIREFVRYDIGELPVLYFPRAMPVFLIAKDELNNPNFHLWKKYEFQIQDYGFFEIEYLGHFFSFPTIRMFELGIDKYLAESMKQKSKYLKRPVLLKYLNQIDLTLSIMDL